MEEIAMTIARVLTVAVITLSGIYLAAQQAGVTAQQSAAAAHTDASASESAAAGANMRSVSGQLDGKLDAKTARPGDSVIVKTTDKMRMADGTEIPKGTRLMGHVTQVQAHGSGHTDSSIGIAFDRAEFKGGRVLPIHSTILSVSQPASALAVASAGADDSMGGAAMNGGAMNGGAMAGGMAGGGMAGGRAGGGLAAGGLVGGTVGGVPSAAGRTTSDLGSNLGATTGGALNTAGNMTGQTASSLGAETRAAAGGTLSLAPHATGVPGVMLAGDASGSASGVLSASKRNVHLDSGTQIELGISGDISPAAR
jgi:hypothetical protein